MTGDSVSSPHLGGPIAWYKLDEGAGTIVNNSGIGDTSLNGTLGPGSSAPTWTSGKINKALSFNGSGNLITIGSTISPIQSISFWVNPNGIVNNIFLSLNSSISIGASNNAIVTIGISSPQIYINGISTSLLSANVWQHVVISTRSTLNGSNINIGKNNNSYFTGLLDNVKIYNYALSSDEVKSDYNQGMATVFGQSTQTVGATTTSLDYCVPGDTAYCANPIAEWKFEEGIGTTAYDTSGNSNNATFASGSSAPSWATGKIGKGLNFPGNNYLSAGTASNLNLTSTITVEAWVKTTTSTIIQTGIISRMNDGNPYQGFELGMNGSSAYFHTGGTYAANILQGSKNIIDGKWHHLTGMYDGTYASLYVDGSLDLSAAKTNNLNGGSSELFDIGTNYNRQAGRFFNGAIDQVRLYNYARTPAQIAYDYNRGGPIGWWKFDECQGSIANDSSGIGNSGTITIGSSGSQNSLGTCAVGTSAAWTNGATGKLNASLNFDGTDDYVDMGTMPSINTGVSQLTVSAWVKPNTLANLKAVVYRDDPVAGVGGWAMGTAISSSSDVIVAVTGSSYGQSTSGLFSNGNWGHWTMVFDGTQTGNANRMKFYFNGIQQPLTFTGTIPSTSAFSPVDVTVGMRVGATRAFNGQIDDVRIYNYALTSSQVKTLYNNGAVNFK